MLTNLRAIRAFRAIAAGETFGAIAGAPMSGDRYLGLAVAYDLVIGCAAGTKVDGRKKGGFVRAPCRPIDSLHEFVLARGAGHGFEAGCFGFRRR